MAYYILRHYFFLYPKYDRSGGGPYPPIVPHGGGYREIRFEPVDPDTSYLVPSLSHPKIELERSTPSFAPLDSQISESESRFRISSSEGAGLNGSVSRFSELQESFPLLFLLLWWMVPGSHKIHLLS